MSLRGEREKSSLLCFASATSGHGEGAVVAPRQKSCGCESLPRFPTQRWLIKQQNESVCLKWIHLIPQCQYKGPPVCDVCGDVRALSESFKNEDFIFTES